MASYWEDTKPVAEKTARKIEREMADPMADLIAETEGERNAAQQQVEMLRELIVLILESVDLPDDIATKIDAMLRG